MSTMISRTIRIAVAASLAMTLVVPSALAVDPVPTVQYNAIINGVSLYGMDEAGVRGVIGTAGKLQAQPITVTIGTVKRTLDPKSITYVTNSDALVNAALYGSYVDTSTPVELKPAYAVGKGATSTWLTKQNVKRAPVDAKRWITGRTIHVRKSRVGYKTDVTGGTTAIIAAAKRSIASTSTPQSAKVKTITVQPKVTNTKLGKAIVVSLSQRRVTLYRTASTKKEISFRCAVGMPAYPTPKGTWKIVGKNPHPGWTNPGSAWAKNMPSYIPPGPSNPLGLRALYLNAPGIRIHGTSNYSSIGHAASHGCIRLKNSEVTKLYPRVPVGTTVYIVK